MRRGLLILGLGLVGAAIAYCCFYLAGTAAPREWLHSGQPELAWLKHEFKLSDAEFSRITKLHEAYLPQCKARCRRIADLNNKLTNAVGSAAQVTPEIGRLLDERARMRAECQAEMLKHFFEVSRTMPPEQGKRYLVWVQEQTFLREQMMNHDATGDASHRE
ncbi:MAG: hypothetical protein DME19_09415 [Verrucomicrobia bacterium]|nr:MAG: hypothetical protein DME19_09415 [Verrucomicrobiota bacterium]